MQILSDLLISSSIDPARLERHKRCEICRGNGPHLYQGYICSERVCRDLWGALADLHWTKGGKTRKKDIKEVFLSLAGTFLDKILGRKQT